MIRIKPGRYKERVEIESDLTYISLIGDDVTTTIITFDRNNGWTEWPEVPVDHLYYAEYDNSGLGADTSKRVNWKGYHDVKKWMEADWFTVAKVIDGDSWVPETSVPYRSGLRIVS
ncbi:putative pectinesterase/pectinesterase inhibitor 61 [Morus notabilis]|uniref:Putative pectinesterase/pectinesterase inhibitor 61 n=1 Tax=Morus notabilis TaxID=981085 RepID=W9QF44_9ROSA|nr:putative pectinesterase/pectinesterase inhibitor 61 [Morus notabilis]